MTSGSWNKAQGDLFKKSYKRAKRAIKAGFYLEAVSLTESLILNRLEVVLRYSTGQIYDRFSVGKIVTNLKSNKVHAFDETLWDDCAAWAKPRGELTHKFAFVAFDEGLSWIKRIRLARKLAVDGLALANRCSKEALKHKQ